MLRRLLRRYGVLRLTAGLTLTAVAISLGLTTLFSYTLGGAPGHAAASR